MIRPMLLILALVWIVLAEGGAPPPPIDTIVLPQATYPVGTFTLSAQAIPTGYTRGTLELDKQLWTDPARQAAFAMEFSMDGGTTWNQVTGCAATAEGGGIDPRTGLPSTRTLVGCGLPQPANPNRRIRGSVTISGGSITTTATVRLR